MRARLLGFIAALRDAGIACSVSETLDAMHAVVALGIDRPVLREALAATLVKAHDDRPIFDVVFDRYFGAPPRRARAKPKRQEDGGNGRGGEGEGRGRSGQPNGTGTAPERREERHRQQQREAKAETHTGRRALLTKPFAAMDAREVEAVRELVDDLARRFRARWSRRTQRAKTGRVDVRRTIRRATSRGGVPVELLYRKPRRGKVDLIALLDLSYSAATAASFLLALLTPARRVFRRVLLLAYVDAVTELSYEHGHVVPHGPLDMNARSDFGRALLQVVARYRANLNRNTVLLILGDARNNRRPPRADLLAALQREVRAIVWLNPEQRERWNTGDSVMATYSRHCTIVINAWNLRTLLAALDRLGSAAPLRRRGTAEAAAGVALRSP